MRKIILASRSKARQKLLRQIGLKFRVVGADVKESSSLKGKRCGALVIANAVKKARAAAEQARYRQPADPGAKALAIEAVIDLRALVSARQHLGHFAVLVEDDAVEALYLALGIDGDAIDIVHQRVRPGRRGKCEGGDLVVGSWLTVRPLT